MTDAQRALIEAYGRELAEQAPELTPERRERLAALLSGARGGRLVSPRHVAAMAALPQPLTREELVEREFLYGRPDDAA